MVNQSRIFANEAIYSTRCIPHAEYVPISKGASSVNTVLLKNFATI
jgi:hypothetical protein